MVMPCQRLEQLPGCLHLPHCGGHEIGTPLLIGQLWQPVQYGLNLDNVHVPYDDIDDLWSEDKSCRNNIVDRHLKWIDELAQCSIPIMVMHIMDHYYPPLPNQYGLESIGQIVAAAREAGILIAIENTGDVGLIDYVLTHIESDHLGFAMTAPMIGCTA